ncbi:MAG: ATP-binding cassette domain-containing protein [Clostridiales Family XIII bacterium]|jgi:ATP-binding cassette subfamily F protein 3|nr:ATP-binding cassette domain-containing protein [Clostridiales Family XIII bacterium]
MNVILANELQMAYGADEIFRGVSFSVQSGERIGIVGANGAGKSTLLKLIGGGLAPGGGSLSVQKDLKIGYLKQGQEGRPEDGSGGERAKRALEEILAGLPDILLLDEPTNHLDFERLAWLESRIRHFKGTVLLVSHDRYFLDRVAQRVFDMGGGALTAYKGNYTAFREKKAALLLAAEKAYKRDAEEYRRQEDMIRGMKERGTEKLAKRAASREKRLAREQRPQAVLTHDSEGRRMHIRFAETRQSGNDVLIAEGLRKSFGGRPLFENVALDVKRGETVCMVGANGIGKTTLFRVLAGQLAPDAGYFERGAGVRVGYYDQHQENLNAGRSLLEEMREAFPATDDTDLRKLLGSFLFTGDKVFQQIGTLSGGEKARLSLLKLIRSGANTLLLDEPTNHLDIASMEVVERALAEFPGTLLIISHDRYLLETLPDRIVELMPRGLENYAGKFDYYMEKRAQAEIALRAAPAGFSAPADGEEAFPEEAAKPESAAARERRRAKEDESARRRKERQVAEAEAAIEAAEAKIASLRAGLADEANATDHESLAELHAALTEAEAALESLLARWETLQMPESVTGQIGR